MCHNCKTTMTSRMISQETNVFGHLVYTKTGLCSQVSLGRFVGYNTLSAMFSVFKLTNN